MSVALIFVNSRHGSMKYFQDVYSPRNPILHDDKPYTYNMRTGARGILQHTQGRGSDNVGSQGLHVQHQHQIYSGANLASTHSLMPRNSHITVDRLLQPIRKFQRKDSLGNLQHHGPTKSLDQQQQRRTQVLLKRAHSSELPGVKHVDWIHNRAPQTN